MNPELTVFERTLINQSSEEIVQSFRKVSAQLEKEQQTRAQAEEKRRGIERSLKQLESKRKANLKESLILHRRSAQLEEVRAFSTYMLRLRLANLIDKERTSRQRKSFCLTSRHTQAQNKQHSLSLFAQNKSRHFERIREEAMQTSMQLHQQQQQEEERTKMLTSFVKEQQLMGRDRLKKYERYRIQQAKDNYRSKVQREREKSLQREALLKELEQVAKQKAIEMNWTTKELQGFSTPICSNSIYLTQ